MKTMPVTPDDLRRSVLAVPPLARNADLSLNKAANQALVKHLEAGGVSTLMYGGNANFYNIGAGEYPAVLDMLEEITGAQTWVIPSVGPDFGRALDQAKILRDRDFPTAMMLPLQFPGTPEGSENGIRRFVDAFGKPAIVYVKNEGVLNPENVARLVDDGLVAGIKYAIVREDPRKDAYLEELVKLVDRSYIISGIGERPAIVHLRDWGLNGFTSGSVCVGPAGSMALLRALKAKDYEQAEKIRANYIALEDLRDGLSPIRVLHEAVTLGGIGDMGPILPMLSNIGAEHHAAIQKAAKELLAYNAQMLAGAEKVPA
ncbi:dihydrodipicolinate synthase family protein [Oceanibaculum pacificum]|uniref:Dihydrodipicolinate synthase family protein n=1 Tax=Oceanibaculum pacificum TaxID=580166 RepID=A0A154W901_9PROT|nr:dihydrodipicolinate synthase family protein [Oceanibaculum pacificum]KZD10009.1 dihydrodipicolinate synthase family protein [Oceanibaculum pacificum]